MDAGQSKTSRFVTLPGLLLLLFFAVLAVYFQAAQVGLFLLFFFLLCLSARAWSRGVLTRVEVGARPLEDVCHEGEELRLELLVRNHSFFPLVWLDVILPAGPKALLCGEEEEAPAFYQLEGEQHLQNGIRERFVWLLWQQEIRFEEHLRAVRRGAADVSLAYLQAGDGFGLSANARKRPLAVPLRLLVFPRVVPVRVQPFLRISQEAAASRRGQAEDVTVLRGSRPYQPGDPVRRINWRILAAGGRMEVKLYQTVRPGCAAFVPDLGSFVRMEKRSGGAGAASGEPVPVLCAAALEQMISLIASCLEALSARGMPCALILPACAGQKAKLILPERGESVLFACLEALAVLDYDGKETVFPYEEFWRRRQLIGDIWLCTRTDAETRYGGLTELPGSGRVRRLVLEKGSRADCLYAEDVALKRLSGEGEQA